MRLAAFLNPKNIGLKHVRKLDLYLADVLDKCNQQHQANFAIRMILELLPEDQLEKFSWHPWSPFSGDNLVLLYQKQKRMRWLESISLDRNVLEDLQKMPNIAQCFQEVRKIGLPGLARGLGLLPFPTPEHSRSQIGEDHTAREF
jgi:hypothetical protein